MRIEQKADGTYVKVLEPHERRLLEIGYQIQQVVHRRIQELEQELQDLRSLLESFSHQFAALDHRHTGPLPPKIDLTGGAEVQGKLPASMIEGPVAEALVARSVNGFQASGSPEPNKLLALDDQGKFPGSVVGEGADVDKVDGFDASRTPTPGHLLVLDESGRIPQDAMPLEIDATHLGGIPASGYSLVGHRHPNATVEVDGFLSKEDKAKLDGIEPGATADMTPEEILQALLTVDGPDSGLSVTEAAHARQADHAQAADDAARLSGRALTTPGGAEGDRVALTDSQGLVGKAKEAMHAAHADEADHATRSDSAAYADQAGYAYTANQVNEARVAIKVRALNYDPPNPEVGEIWLRTDL